MVTMVLSHALILWDLCILASNSLIMFFRFSFQFFENLFIFLARHIRKDGWDQAFLSLDSEDRQAFMSWAGPLAKDRSLRVIAAEVGEKYSDDERQIRSDEFAAIES